MSMTATGWELGRIALVLGAWCVAGLPLCLTLPVLERRQPARRRRPTCRR